MAALLEEARMLIVCACHLLTDECPGETPTIPDAISKACISSDGSDNEQCILAISSLVDLLMKVSEAQATRVSMHPEESACSPLLSKTLLWFFRRWAAAYVFPTSDDYKQSGGIYGKWSTQEQAQPVISFCTTLCLLNFCHLPLGELDSMPHFFYLNFKPYPYDNRLSVSSIYQKRKYKTNATHSYWPLRKEGLPFENYWSTLHLLSKLQLFMQFVLHLDRTHPQACQTLTHLGEESPQLWSEGISVCHVSIGQGY
jgi:hypothetical protein